MPEFRSCTWPLLLVTFGAASCSPTELDPPEAPSPGPELEAQAARVPTITSIDPPLASSQGNVTLTVTGRSFAPGAQVYISGVQMLSPAVVSSTKMMVTMPGVELAAGKATVRVVNPGGRQSERTDVLTLFAEPIALSLLRPTLWAPPLMSSLVLGDFNGDGWLDGVATSSYSSFYIQLLKGRSALGPASGMSLSGYSGRPPAVGDFNGDGKLDLAVPSTMSGPGVLLGLGDGNFESQRPTLGLPGGLNLVSADLNKDGRTDLIDGGFIALNTWRGTSGGDLSLAGSYPLPALASALLTLDANGDGKVDVVVGHQSGRTSLFLGNGDGTLTASTAPAAAPSEVRALGGGDLNGDGKADYVAVTSGKLAVRLGKGDGTFTSVADVGVPSDVWAVQAADFNGDGRTDLYLNDDTKSGGPSILLLGKGDGTFQAPRAISPAPLREVRYAVAADVDKDGRIDLVTASTMDNAAAFLFGRGDGSFYEDAVVPAVPSAITGADLNGDGKQDAVVVSAGSNKAYVLLGNGDGTLQAARAFDVDRGPSAVTVSDWNGDGKADLAVANYDANTVSLLPGNGDGTFQPQRTFSVGKGPNQVLAVDVNADSKLDLVTADYEGDTVSVLINNGTGNFNPAKSYATGKGPAAVAAGDMNGDGRIDLVSANADAGTVSYLQQSAATAGAFNSAKSVTTGAGPSAIAVGDWNGDGKADFVTGCSDSSSLGLHLGKGDGTFVGQRSIGGAGFVTGMSVADMNADGRKDLVIEVAPGGVSAIFLGQADGSFALSARGVQSSGALGVIDLTGDGKPEMLMGGSRDGDSLLSILNVSK